MRKLKKTEVIVNGVIWTKEMLQELVSTNEKALYKAMNRIYDKQTADEKIDQDTKEYNTVGFSGVDGQIMSNLTEFYNQRHYLSPKQKTLAVKKMRKYCGQLLRLMAEDNRLYNEHFFKERKRKSA